MSQEREVLVEVKNLKKHFPIRRGVIRRQVGAVQAVDGVTFDIYKGETLGLVGESGCGKSTTGRTILQLLAPTAGEVKFLDKDLTTLAKEELRKARRNMQMIFQDPYASLNPRMTVSRIVGEPLEIHNIGNANSRKERVQELLRVVGLNPYFVNRYPHEFSGGNASELVSLALWRRTPHLLSPMSRFRPSMSPFKPRLLTYWMISRRSWGLHIYSLLMIYPW